MGSVRYFSTLSTDTRPESNKNMTKKYGSFSTLDPSLASSTDRIDSANVSNSYEQIFSGKQDLSQHSSPVKKVYRGQNSEIGPGLSQILSTPTNYYKNNIFPVKLNSDHELNNTTVKNIGEVANCDKIEVIEKKAESVVSASCVDCNIEQGLDILDPTHNLICSSQNEHSVAEDTNDLSNSEPITMNKMQRRISRSLGSYTDDEKLEAEHPNPQMGSDPLLKGSPANPDTNLSDQSLPNSLGDGRKEFLQHWFNNASALVCSEENLCSDILGTTEQEDVSDNNLTMRTEALVQKTTTFHLVKPRH